MDATDGTGRQVRTLDMTWHSIHVGSYVIDGPRAQAERLADKLRTRFPGAIIDITEPRRSNP